MIVVLCSMIFCGCETEEEKDAREAREYAEEVNERYQDLLEEDNDIKNFLEKYNN